jgi:hypothetical protein
MITCVWKLESPLGELYRSGSIIPRRLSIGIFLLVGRGASTGQRTPHSNIPMSYSFLLVHLFLMTD